MQIEPLWPKLKRYLARRGLAEKFEKHPSLSTELLEPKEFKLYSFRIDRKCRVIFYFKTSNSIEIVDINDHYQ